MKVDIIIAGTQKCGTTALFTFLSSHPKVIGSNKKEINYFNFDSNYEKGESFYHSFFKPKSALTRLRGYRYIESTPAYASAMNAEKNAARIKSYNPKAKIIIMVRNPIMRAFSAWKMYQKRALEGNKDWFVNRFIKMNQHYDHIVRRTDEEYQNFYNYLIHESECERKETPIEAPVLLHGHYWRGITVFRKYFGANVLVVKNEDLLANTTGELQVVADFLGLSQFDWSIYDNEIVFSGNYDEQPSADVITLLESYYKESNRKLLELTGINYT